MGDLIRFNEYLLKKKDNDSSSFIGMEYKVISLYTWDSICNELKVCKEMILYSILFGTNAIMNRSVLHILVYENDCFNEIYFSKNKEKLKNFLLKKWFLKIKDIKFVDKFNI